MWKRALVSGVLSVCFCFCFLIAQEPGGPGRGGFGFRFRGPGGFGGVPTSDVFLANIPEVQQELKFTDDQKKSAADLQRDMQEKIRTAWEGVNFQELQTLEPEQRDKQFVAMRLKGEAAGQEADKSLHKQLAESQIKRLAQLRLQRDEIAALSRHEIVQQLGLNDEQLKNVRDAQEQNEGFFGPPDQREKRKSEVLALLTEEQRTKWNSLLGTKFNFPENAFSFGRGPGGPMQAERKLLKQFDKNGDGRLNADERKEAREFVKKNPASGPGGGGRGGPPGGGLGGFGPPGFGPPGFSPPGGGPPGGGRPGFGGREREPVKPGPKVAAKDVRPIDAPLYDTTVLRTLFLEFDNPEWEAELADFYRSDVEVPATLIVDGETYPNVGVHFRGMSSYFTVGAGQKRSLNVSLDFVDDKQRLYGYKTLNLLNSHEDPTFMHTVLYSHVARQYIPAPKANFVKLVINGESWGVYVNVQQFNKEFLAENYSNAKGTRWKVRGSPGGRGGLEYLGDDLEEYKRRYEMKSNDGEDAWKSLIALCKTLNQTPVDQLEKALEPLLDVDGAIWFLALENALINSDGYWIRASDYCIFRDNKNKFHVIPHDMNETFQAAMGPGMGGPGVGGPGRGGFGGRAGGTPGTGGAPTENRPVASGEQPHGGGGGGMDLDPLTGLNDSSKPLRSRLLAVPKWKTRYLQHVRTIATDWLDWKKLQPIVNQHVNLIGSEIEADTRKLSSYSAFRLTTSGEATDSSETRRPPQTLRAFAEKRREYLLDHPEIKKLTP